MLQTFEAVLDADGKLHPLEKIDLGAPQKVLVTMLTTHPQLERTDRAAAGSVQNMGEIIGDLEEGSREIAALFNEAIERSGREVHGK